VPVKRRQKGLTTADTESTEGAQSINLRLEIGDFKSPI
jgi:hypothetical protein